jgi:hypothetical protein
LSASVNVRYILQTQLLGLYNKILVGYLFVLRYSCLLSTPPFLLISPIIQMVKRIRNANAENNAENINVANLLPLPTLE